ncbi:MAG: hypothetical protein AMXMBFR46_28210 [Acidimicrobiia bacterium]
MATHDIGDVVKLTGTFRDAAGDLADPTAVTVTVLEPDGTTSTPTASSASTGVWTATVSIDQSGTWRYRWAGTGVVVTAEEGAFDVRPRRVPAA